MTGRVLKVSAAVAACLVAAWLVGGDALSAKDKKADKAAGASGELTNIAPVENVVALFAEINKAAAINIDDDEPESCGAKFSVAAELAKLQTLRADSDLKAWAGKIAAAYTKGARDDLDKADAQAVLKETKALLAEADKKMKAWAGAKPGTGKYVTANKDLKLLMEYVGTVHSETRRKLGQPGINLQKAQINPAWALSEIGNVAILFSKEKDWKEWSASQRDNYANVAKLIAKGEINEAKKSFDMAQANCKACHDKYQSDAPSGN